MNTHEIRQPTLKNLLSKYARLALAGLVATASIQFAQAQIATMPPQTSTFSGMTRGYWFTAPVDFQITGIHVLAPTGSGNSIMNWAVIRFDGATPPPVYSGVTSAFTQLGLGFDQPANAFAPTSINISAGDVIGIYGNTTLTFAGTGDNSYASAGLTTTIFGNTVALTRSGMQYNLGSSTSPAGMHDVWQEIGSISRVEFSYTSVPEPTTAALALLGVGGLALTRRQARH